MKEANANSLGISFDSMTYPKNFLFPKLPDIFYDTASCPQ